MPMNIIALSALCVHNQNHKVVEKVEGVRLSTDEEEQNSAPWFDRDSNS
jgi:hypothetical protein